ncbi:LysR substrate-binding domain-containing protein [Amorphoplanes digitatis]|uniref:DNA-binding transcriptional LysR family regulator n=1 Tax=Actinoplanes digitatis TaxID=1868 RepID=A0A7W7MMT6_9ACTN|nr:LysR substrate-binding domain-containing protein [Actinoplanes digitatis]MBB4760283.1 DNA-binding transcriptional LysR family regulator [Actinoplanes digitatis]GID98136.1 transcriptional regulator [Actinoplanes digitatis]
MLDVHRLRLLRELDRRGTLAAVARALSYSPSAISQQLTQLESETGATLLEHVGRGVRLTEQARILVRHTDVILERLELAEADLARSMTEVTGGLRVASFQSVMLALVPSALSSLAARHPALRVQIAHCDAAAAIAGLVAHDFDLVLGEEYPGLPQPRMPGVDEEDLSHDEMRFAVPPDGPWSRARLPDLAGAPFVFDPADLAPGQWARNMCRDAGFEPDVRFASGDLLLQVRLVETGHAVAFLPDLLWTDRSPGPVRLHHLPGRPRRRLFTAVRAGAGGQPRIRVFREALRASVAPGE